MKTPRQTAGNGPPFNAETSGAGGDTPTPLAFLVPIQTARGGNNREHHFARHRRVERERKAVGLAFLAHRYGAQWRKSPPYLVHLVRVSPGTRPMDDDGVVSALKSVRDEVAARLKLDDGQRHLIRFTYGQERGPWGVRVTIQPLEETP